MCMFGHPFPRDVGRPFWAHIVKNVRCGRPIGSRRWGSPRGAKGGTFLLVSLVGLAAGLEGGGH